MATACTDSNHPLYKKFSKMYFKDSVKLLQNNPSIMRQVSLGEALDFISWGGINWVGYKFAPKKMARFIENWMHANIQNLQWNKKEYDLPTIPKINYEVCPRNEIHTKTIYDHKGNLRCIECTSEETFKQEFVMQHKICDHHSNISKLQFSDQKPEEPYQDYYENGELIDMTWEFEEFKEEMKKYNESQEFEVKDFCYAIIKETPNKPLPLEKILSRINVSNKFFKSEKYFINPFSGFTLANYVHAWHNQIGEKELYMKEGEIDSYKLFQGFVPICSDD